MKKETLIQLSPLYERLSTIDSLKGMLEVALDILNEMPKPITQISGPISTGGKGSIEANLKAISDAILWLEEREHNVFDQTPFERPMHLIVKQHQKEGYPYALLDEFYLPIFESGLVQTIAFLPDWESSTGATWEHEQARKLGLSAYYLPHDWDK